MVHELEMIEACKSAAVLVLDIARAMATTPARRAEFSVILNQSIASLNRPQARLARLVTEALRRD
jgi:hypothetical protein